MNWSPSMSDEKDDTSKQNLPLSIPEEIPEELQNIVDNVINIDEGRIKRLREHGHYFSLLEQFDVLRVRFIYDTLDEDEARNFVTLCKYFKENGHSESLRLTCYYIYKRYIEKQGL